MAVEEHSNSVEHVDSIPVAGDLVLELGSLIPQFCLQKDFHSTGVGVDGVPTS